jgi:hypothetical protein
MSNTKLFIFPCGKKEKKGDEMNHTGNKMMSGWS